MASKIKVDEIEEQSSGSNITLKNNVVIPTGKTLTITDGIATSKITSGTFADARISESSVTQHTVTADLTPAKHDIAMLALQSAVADNKAAFNLTNSFIDKFEDDTGIGTETDCDRQTDEYIATVYSITSQFTNDSNTKLLLHFDGSNASTTFTDSSSSSHSASAVSNAQLDTSIKKFGTASLQLDGSSDAVNVTASSDFAFAGDFTMETWVYYNSGSIDAKKVFIMNGAHDTAYQIHMFKESDNKMAYQLRNSSNANISMGDTSAQAELVADRWYHCAWTRDGDIFRHYVDGVQLLANDDSDITGTLGNGSATFQIGKRHDAESIDGYLDEFRISDTCRYPDGTTFVPNSSTAGTAR